MSLNDIQLPVSVIIDLYKNSLVEIPEANVPKARGNDDPRALIGYLGDNRKNISILVSCLQHPFLPEQELDLLISILKACQLALPDVALVNVAQYRPDLPTLKTQLATEVLLIFGSDSRPANSDTSVEFDVFNLEGITGLCVPELEKLNQNNAEGKVYKKKLWTVLKQLFRVA